MKHFLLSSGILLFAPTSHLLAQTCGFPNEVPSPTWQSENFYQQYDQPSLAREIAVIKEVMAGNIPDRTRETKTIVLITTIKGETAKIEIPVAIDYLAIGTNTDFVRAPLTNVAAQYLAGEMGFTLPTPYLVDQIYNQADVQMTPQPTDWYKVDIQMRLGLNYIVFNNTIEQQRAGRDGLVAGHKKDVVLTNLLDASPNRVAIYGWQMPGNIPIQPLAIPHDIAYEDYSHGIRFVGPTVKITWTSTGQAQVLSIVEALKDPSLGPVLNGGSALNDVRAARECVAGFSDAVGLPASSVCPPQPQGCQN